MEEGELKADIDLSSVAYEDEITVAKLKEDSVPIPFASAVIKVKVSCICVFLFTFCYTFVGITKVNISRVGYVECEIYLLECNLPFCLSYSHFFYFMLQICIF